jgi:uncharacterized delta-60 repeat protein
VGFNDNVETISINSEGKIFAGGYFDTFSGSSQSRLIKTLNYSLDTSFNVGTGFNGNLDKIAVQSDGKILVAGGFTSYNSLTGNTYFMRLNSDGTKDTSFDAGDFNQGDGLNGVPSSIVIQTDGKIVAGGLFTQFSGLSQSSLIRFNSDGSKDTSFDVGTGFAGGSVFALAIQSDGKILAGGRFTSYRGSSRNKIIRLNSDATRDTSFPSGGGGFLSTTTIQISAIEIQSDGKILVGGNFTSYSGSTQNRLIRLNSDGTKDTSFDIGTGFNSSVASIAIQSDGKILVGGAFTTFTGSTQNYLIRLNSNGSKDTSFDVGTGFNGLPASIAIQSDGKILIGGSFNSYQGLFTYFSILLNSNGSISNNTLRLGDSVTSVVIQ